MSSSRSLRFSARDRWSPISARQRIFRDWTLGTLLYAAVMGFFDDYTDYLIVESFSSLFLAAFVMQALTFFTFGLKKTVSRWYRGRSGTGIKVAHGLSIWAIMFFSKFVFLEVIDIIFGDAVNVTSFVGLILIIASMVVLQRLIDLADTLLADEPPDKSPMPDRAEAP